MIGNTYLESKFFKNVFQNSYYYNVLQQQSHWESKKLPKTI